MKYFLIALTVTLNTFSADLSMAAFDKKARDKEPLSVVFFGGSLTWGANASDPNRTSYRGLMMEYLQGKYPGTPFRFHDAAIGGTGSDLGMFRLERDVLSQKPDLVFLDFTVNDDMEGTDGEALASYEFLVRSLLKKNIPVVQVIMACGYHYRKDYSSDEMTRRRDHLKLARHYNLPVADIYPFMGEKLSSGQLTVPGVWPFEQTHPDDPGYKVFFDVVKVAYEKAVSEKQACNLPEESLFQELYKAPRRIRLVDNQLPEGWGRGKTYRTSMWYDGLSSRWMDDVALMDANKAHRFTSLRMKFKGTFLGLIGESNHEGLAFMIKIDGKIFPKVNPKTGESSNVWKWDTSRFGKGNLLRWLRVSNSLTSGEHTLEIIPVISSSTKKGQLRIESICAAGE